MAIVLGNRLYEKLKSLSGISDATTQPISTGPECESSWSSDLVQTIMTDTEKLKECYATIKLLQEMVAALKKEIDELKSGKKLKV